MKANKEKNGVYQARSGKWGIAYTDNDGKRCHEIVANSQAAAKVARARKINELMLLKTNPALAYKDKTFGDFADLFMAKHINLLRSCKSYKSMFQGVQAHFKDYKLKDITPVLVKEYYNNECSRTSASTANRCFGILSKFFNFLIDSEKFTGQNPCSRVKKSPDRYYQPNPLNQKEIAALMEHLADYIKPCVSFAICTGLRRKELLNLRWEDINFNDNCFIIPETKTDNPRTVGLPDDLKALLEKLGRKSRGRVFAVTKDQLRYQLTRASKLAGLPHMRVHDMRHSFSKNFLDRGGSLVHLKELMGHKSLKTTQKYLKFKGNEVASKMVIMDGLIVAAQKPAGNSDL